MDYYYIILLGIAAFLSIRNEKNIQRKRLFIGIYTTLIVVAFFYMAGESIGKLIYHLTHS